MNVPDFLLDLDVILDFLQDRRPHAQYAGRLLAAAHEGRVSLWISGDAPSTLFYVLERQLRQEKVKAASAVEAGVGTLVTRDGTVYRDLPQDLLAVLTPLEALVRVGTRSGPAKGTPGN